MNKKKIIILIISILFILISTTIYLCVKNNKLPYSFSEKDANIDTLYIYGNHLNIKGSLKITNILDAKLVFYNKKNKKEYDLLLESKETETNFYISSKKNNGILLDNMEIGNYVIFLQVTDNSHKTSYYKLKNNSGYSKTKYYTIKTGKKLVFQEKNYETLNLNVSKNSTKNIYDVVIDAGHGGIDSGACYNNNCEREITLNLSLKLKEKLEEEGLKVKLTRDANIDNETKFNTYGKEGRIDIAMSSKAKYLFSFHLNSGLTSRTGTEIYTTNNIDYTLAHSIVDSIVKNTNTNYSNNPIFKVDNGIYTRTFKEYEINDAKTEALEKEYEPYEITTDTTYYYIIRETGGFMTGAYTDGRDSKNENKYYNTNVGIESYILELGYITNENDTKDIVDNMDAYIDAIKKAIIDNICE